MATFERALESVLPHVSRVARASRLHGPDHWRRVAKNGEELCRSTPGADPYIVLLFSLFHDSRRFSDGRDPGHGARGAELARSLRGSVFEATDEELALLEEACRRHADGGVSRDPTIGVCWDADRLDLGRIGVMPNPRFLSTTAARLQARRLGGAGGWERVGV